MQPQNEQDETWQQPSPQPSQAPYATPPLEAQGVSPVVTMENPNVQQNDMHVGPEEERPSEPVDTEQPIHWQAKEFISHNRNTVWFVFFALIVVVLMAVAVFLMSSITFAILVPVMAVALIVYLRRPPRTIDYTLSRQGLHINDQLYSFAEFKGFGVIRDGQEYSVMLIPVKRFRQGVMVYFPEESGEAIVDMLGARLPMLELHLDIVDQIIRKLRL